MSYQIVNDFTKFWESPTVEIHFDRRGMPLRRNRHKVSSSVASALSLPQPMLGCLIKVSSVGGLTALLAGLSREKLVPFSHLPMLHEIQAFLKRR